MPAYTMLGVVQNILSDMVSDEVNSISDTEEATLVAQVIQNVFYSWSATEIIPNQNRVFRLDASGDSDLPCEMILPANIVKVNTVKYNKKLAITDKDAYRTVHYMDREEFLNLTLGRDSSLSTTESMVLTESDDDVEIQIINDTHPSYYTLFGSERIVFDSYYNTLDTTLQNSKTICTGRYEPTLAIADGTVIDMPPDVMVGFLAECKAVCFNNFKQQVNGPAVIEARRGRNNALWHAGRVKAEGRQRSYPVGR